MVGSHNLYLIGPMGSGKTAVGKHLARLLQYPFVDSDREIELITGADIPLIFEREGENGFRRREQEMIAQLVLRQRIVLATGGGAVLDETNRRLLAAHGWIAYLETSASQQATRAGRTRHRPLLHGHADPETRLAQLLAIREPLYRSIADFSTCTDHQRVATVAAEIVGAFHRANAGAPP
jgi:shikimate kinase